MEEEGNTIRQIIKLLLYQIFKNMRGICQFKRKG